MSALLIHNPRCSKSRQTKELLESQGVEFTTYEYLKEGLSEELLLRLKNELNLEFESFVRTKESVYKELGLSDKKMSQNEWISVLSQNPVLLERPIFSTGYKAAIGRPPEEVLKLL